MIRYLKLQTLYEYQITLFLLDFMKQQTVVINIAGNIHSSQKPIHIIRRHNQIRWLTR